MRKIILLLIGFSFLVFQNSYGQSFKVPKKYKFTTAEDYDLYANDIVEAAKWLESVPFNEQTEKRKEVSTFVVSWISGSPKVSVELYKCILDFDKKNQGMMILYMACCARYVIDNNYSSEVDEKHKYALKAMMNVYKEGKGIKKDKKMDKLIKSDEDGTLDEWMEKELK